MALFGFLGTFPRSLIADRAALAMEIEIEGRIEKGHTLPRTFVRISRRRGSAHIEAAIPQPNHPEITHRILAHDYEEAPWAMAECLFETLEGHGGTNSDILNSWRRLHEEADEANWKRSCRGHCAAGWSRHRRAHPDDLLPALRAEADRPAAGQHHGARAGQGRQPVGARGGAGTCLAGERRLR